MRYAKIIGTGSYLPTHIVKNTDLEQTLDITSDWIIKRTGICQRHIANAQETSAFMATHAAQKALKMANEVSVDMIIVATTTPDAFIPSTACIVQAALQLKACPAFDITAACAGFNYALSIAEQFIKSGTYQKILVIGSEAMSQVLNWEDRSTCVLFGDGAGAVVLGASDAPGILGTHIHAEGEHQDLIRINHLRSPDAGILTMDGPAVFKQAVTKMTKSMMAILKAHHLSIKDLDWLVPHQANLRIIRTLAKQLDLPEKQIIITIDRHANTSSASVPLALDQAIRDNRIQPGQLLLLESFGGGITWGNTLVRY